MQFTAVWIKRFIVGDRMSLNDVCCYIPAWFGCIATIFVGGIAYECTLSCNTSSSILKFCIDLMHGSISSEKIDGSAKRNILGLESPAFEAAVASMLLMAIVPAHLMRSIGGGYDNESVAITAMCLTFYLWIRSLRDGGGQKNLLLFGSLSGVAYFYVSIGVVHGYLETFNVSYLATSL
jgi:dolichyl-diphosphooligosaccharide--protein glycosyltransferase